MEIRPGRLVPQRFASPKSTLSQTMRQLLAAETRLKDQGGTWCHKPKWLKAVAKCPSPPSASCPPIPPGHILKSLDLFLGQRKIAWGWDSWRAPYNSWHFFQSLSTLVDYSNIPSVYLSYLSVSALKYIHVIVRFWVFHLQFVNSLLFSCCIPMFFRLLAASPSFGDAITVLPSQHSSWCLPLGKDWRFDWDRSIDNFCWIYICTYMCTYTYTFAFIYIYICTRIETHIVWIPSPRTCHSPRP